MRLFGLVGGACLWALTAFSAGPDSLRVTSLLREASALSAEQNKILYFAKGFQGIPYAGNTLEAFPVEQLVVRTDSVDCTTFVEYVLALYLTDKSESRDYATFKQALQHIRYRNGVLDGYVSRLHYFSDWICDNEKKGIVREVTVDSPHEYRKVTLDFMSTHASKYPQLARNDDAVQAMKTVESQWTNFKMPFIAKVQLGAGADVLQIKDGDILALATQIKGLDVVHLGFACWIKGKLHLLHASSVKKKVILDPLALVDYSRAIRSHIGVRVIRICP